MNLTDSNNLPKPKAILWTLVLQYIGSLEVGRPGSRMEIVAAMRRIRVRPCDFIETDAIFKPFDNGLWIFNKLSESLMLSHRTHLHPDCLFSEATTPRRLHPQIAPPPPVGAWHTPVRFGALSLAVSILLWNTGNERGRGGKEEISSEHSPAQDEAAQTRSTAVAHSSTECRGFGCFACQLLDLI